MEMRKKIRRKKKQFYLQKNFMENTYEGHGNSVSGSSFKKRSWSLAQLSQWPSLLHWRLEMGSSHKWHSTNRGPQHTAKQHERKNQKTTTRPTIRAQVWNGSSRCSHGSISEMRQNYLKNFGHCHHFGAKNWFFYNLEFSGTDFFLLYKVVMNDVKCLAWFES